MDLIDQFFTLAKIESGDKKIELSKINICEICRESILDFYEILTKQNFQVEVDVPEMPINGLDPAGIKQIRELLKTLCQDYGVTIMISSHILSEIESITDTIGIIHQGRMRKEVSMKEIEKKNLAYIEVSLADTKKAAFTLSEILKAVVMAAILSLLVFALAYLGIANDSETGVPDTAPGKDTISSSCLPARCLLLLLSVLIKIKR